MLRKLWSLLEVCTYHNKTESQVKKWMKDGLKSTMLSGAYYFDYNDIVEYLMED